MSMEEKRVSLGCWVISAIGLVATAFMVWVLASVTRDQNRQPMQVLMISHIRPAVAILETEDSLPDEDNVFACAKGVRNGYGA